MSPTAFLGQLKPFELPDPVDERRKLADLSLAESQAAEYKNKAAEQTAIKSAFQPVKEVGADGQPVLRQPKLEEIFPKIAAVNPAAAFSYAKGVHEQETAQREAKKAEITQQIEQNKLDAAKAEDAANIIGSATDERSFPLVIQNLIQRGHTEAAKQMAQYKPGSPEFAAFQKQVVAGTQDAKTKAELASKALTDQHTQLQIDQATAEEKQKALLRPWQLLAEKNKALTSTPSPETGLTKEQQAQLDQQKAAATETTDTRNYKKALAEGFKGTFLDYQKFDANLKTPKPDTGIAAQGLLDREANTYRAPHQKALTDADAKLQTVADAKAMINSGAEGQALGLPKVLSALVGGVGSGLRMTQPELNSIANARGVVGDIQGFFNSFTGKGKLTGEQKRQLTQILDDVKARVEQKRAIVNDALDRINSAGSKAEIVKVDSETRAKLHEMETGTLPKGNGKTIDKATAQEFYKAAGGDPKKAQKLAEDNGWKVQ